jgi:CarboxypepD_reg-like domain
MKFLFLFVFLPCIALGQNVLKGVVVNAKNEPLPLTNIVTQQKFIGTITNEKGEFELMNVAKTDTLKITNVSFLPKLLAVQTFRNNDTIRLVDKIQQLDEVVVRNFSGFTNEQTIGFKDRSTNGEFQLLPGNQLAVYMSNTNQREGWLKGIYFKVKKIGKCKNSMRIRIFNVSAAPFMPYVDLLHENVIIDNSNIRKKNFIDLSAYKIIFPKEGVFAVLEWLYPDKDCDKAAYTSISATLTVPQNLVWLNYRDRQWGHSNRPRLPNGNFMTPSISLQVAY